MKKLAWFASALLVLLASPATAPRAEQRNGPSDVEAALRPTNHQRLPSDPSEFWLTPAMPQGVPSAARREFAAAVKLEVDGNFAKALLTFSQPAQQQGPLGDYAIYYQGLAELRVGRPADARNTFRALAAKPPVGYLAEAVAWREAECDEALGEQDAALDVYERLTKMRTIAPEEALMRVGRIAKALGQTEKSAQAFSRVLYEFPFSDSAPNAAGELDGMPLTPMTEGSARYKLELGRGERLFGARRYTAARPVFEPLKRLARGDDRELVDLRLAECDYFMKRPRNARDGVKPYIEKAKRQGEALYFYAVAIRELGEQGEYEGLIRRLVDEFSDQSWAEEALNNLAMRHVVQGEDEEADVAFREMYEKFPEGHYAERAAWKIGWRAYRNGRYADTVRAFESGAAHFPRSDYRPSWLYWSARAHEALKETALAEARYALVATDYLNTYYGRLVVARFGRTPLRLLTVEARAGQPAAEDEGELLGPLPPNAGIVRALLGLGLYDQALDELHCAQKAWGDSSAIQATLGWIDNQRGDLRSGINFMKRAYPQYLAAGGDAIPDALLKVRFPVNYWPLIKRYSSERQLDPFMMAALIAQESTFTVDAKSPANAYGLMQIVPATGRQYAKTLGITRKFSIGMLTTADTNIRLGTAYFADLVRRFGGVPYALATYNAGPGRVARWLADRPGLDREEFIDDIPFPETQDYVRKIIAQAEDYRRLYGTQ